MAMPGSAERLRKIRQVITQQIVTTQDELAALLRRGGIRVTQATISRDIKHLGLVKIPSSDGHYRYALPGATPEPPPEAAQRLRTAFMEFANAVERGSDLILVKTVPGGASPVAEAIDDMHWSDVAGTVAGENTIIVVPRSRGAARAVLQRLTQLLPR